MSWKPESKEIEPESIVFDKAEHAELLENLRERLKSMMDEIEQQKGLLSESKDEEAEKEATSDASGGAKIGFDYDNPPQAVVEPPKPQEPPSLRALANCIEKTAEFICK